jgi:hypothetical protein
MVLDHLSHYWSAKCISVTPNISEAGETVWPVNAWFTQAALFHVSVFLVYHLYIICHILRIVNMNLKS